MLKKFYEVYFLDDYMETFKSKKEAEDFINESVAFDKRMKNPWGASKQNYSIEEVEIEL